MQHIGAKIILKDAPAIIALQVTLDILNARNVPVI